MISSHEHANRRQALHGAVGRPVLLMANGERPRNLPMNKLPFRQDSSFLYYTGCTRPGAAAGIDEHGLTLFLPPDAPDDDLWHGPTPSMLEQGQSLGADRVCSIEQLPEWVQHRQPAVLAVPDSDINRQVSQWTGADLHFGAANGDPELVTAIIRHRRAKSESELEQMRLAARHSKVAHEAVIAATRPGSHERRLAALFQGVLAARGLTLGYGTILTQRGEVLHNHHHDDALEAGRLLLLDGGGELPSGYGVDITRTWPVSGSFTARQRAAYDAVLAAQEASISLCTVSTRYRQVHDASSLVIARFLADEGLIRCSPESAVEAGAHALFFPHGVGHHLGLDVHDLENFGDLPSYPDGRDRPDQFGTCYLRLDLPLEPNWVVTVEPGFYVVPAILGNPVLRERFSKLVDFEAAESWIGFGGIRIEDDVRVVDGAAPEVMTEVVKDPDALCDLVGSGPSAEQLLLWS